jgi:hypothetical protein
MDVEDIKKLAENPDFISGIYNYCDRWCERCLFTQQCMNFALSEEQFSDPETHDMKNKAFWDKLSEIFQLTRQMVEESAEEHGIDLDSLDLQAAAEEHENIRNAAENHECCRAAQIYAQMVKDWFDSASELFEQKEDELNLQVRLELPDSDPAQEAAGLKGAVDVIRWYQHFIYVKLVRAMEGSLEEFAYDSDGSAKVALIAIDRSMAAWGQMHEHFPQHQDDILDIIVHLDRLRRKAEATFPNARAFVRPGLDW